MSNTDIEFFQSFCRKYVNKAVKNHFKDVSGDDENSLSVNVPRQAIKRVCLHKDTDPIMLTIGRLLIWWVEAKGLFDEYIYGIPVTTFHESVAFKPQIKLFWREDSEDAKNNNRYPLRAEYTVRYRGKYESKRDLEQLGKKINSIFNSPKAHVFTKGRTKYSYRDKTKGYELIITANSDNDAKDVINKLLAIQEDSPLDEEFLTKSTSDKNWSKKETVRVAGQAFSKPKKRQVGKVHFTHAEFAVHGMARDRVLVSNLRSRVPTKLI